MKPIEIRSDNRPEMPAIVLPLADRITELLAGVDYEIARRALLTAQHRLNQDLNDGPVACRSAMRSRPGGRI
jgi:hypothetical protein